MNQGTNRHGVPLRQPPRVSRCALPGCTTPLTTYAALHLCDTHVQDVWAAADPALAKTRPQPVEPTPTKRRTAKAPDDAPGVVYYVQVGAHIKIGWTSNLDKRMRTYPPNSVLLAAHAGTRADEHKLHQRFAVHRSHGREWYPLVPVILDHIGRVVAEHGQPDQVAFGAKPVTVPTPRRSQVVAMRSRSGGSYRASA